MKERKIAQWALAYVAGAWALLQVADLIGSRFGWPEVWLRSLIVLLAVGFIAALVVAWYHGEKGRQEVSSIELGMLTALLVLAGAGVGLVRASTAPAANEAGGAENASGLASDAAPAEQGSIAVLPFADLSPGGDQEYFSDGLTEELLNVLSQLPELRVASRTSAFSFKGGGVPLDSIARALNVRHVLEGSVRKAGDQVRVTAQLIDARTGYHLWSESYDRELKDIFAVQDEISREIVEQLQVELSGGQGPLARVETEDPEAHTLVLKAAEVGRPRTPEALVGAEALLEEAITRDPGYARAHAELAVVKEWQVYYGHVPREQGLERARAEARRALALDSTAALAHSTLALIAADYQWDWTAAERHYARALQHNPGFAPAYSQQAWLLMRLGRTEEALVSARRAIELDPVSTSAYNMAGAMYQYAGRPDTAVALFREAIQLGPDQPVLMSNLSMTFALLGRTGDAIRLAEEAAELAPESFLPLLALGYAHAVAGRRDEAEAILERMRALPDPSHYAIASVHAGLGNREAVIARLEAALEAREVWILDLGVDPIFADYRDDPRVRGMLEEMGLE